LSYAAFSIESRRLACELRNLGIGVGDRVAIWLPNSPAWIVTLMACAQLGAIAVATNTRFLSAEMAHILERTAPKALLLWPRFRQIDFLSILDDVPSQSWRSLKTIVAYSEDKAQLPLDISDCRFRASHKCACAILKLAHCYNTASKA